MSKWGKWRQWFAWHPVCIHGLKLRVVWLCYVERRVRCWTYDNDVQYRRIVNG